MQAWLVRSFVLIISVFAAAQTRLFYFKSLSSLPSDSLPCLVNNNFAQSMANSLLKLQVV